ncbi:MAG: hypothetical protein ACN6OJ_20955 [Chryseobacterium sp.]|uniref:hypothetical protein n=1 Tax=Chryseobacterium sp. TaxID=1871047 RepID=UPI003D127E2E
MKITLHTNSVNQLNLNIKNKILEDLPTWERREGTDGYTLYYHSTKSGQWEEDLFVKPFKKAEENKLNFYITKIDGQKIDFIPSFGYLMGRFIEMLIVHFSDQFDSLEITD